MSTRRITLLGIVATFVISAATVAMGADLQHASFSPDRILKGTAPIITMTLDKQIPDNGLKVYIVGDQPVDVQKSGGKLTFQLPKLDIIGTADVKVMTGEKSIATGQLRYVEAIEQLKHVASTEISLNSFVLIVLYAIFIFLPIFAFNFYDIIRSYGERSLVLNKLDSVTTDERKTLLAALNQGPTGLSGLTRGLLALSLILVLAIAIFHLIVFQTMADYVAEQLLTILAGSVASIIGFYFGSKASTEAAKPSQSDSKKIGSNAVPKILKILSDLSKNTLKVAGEGFGNSQEKGKIKVIDKGSNHEITNTVGHWDDKAINVEVTGTLNAGAQIDVVVTNDSGKSSDPYTLEYK
ncbi:MAG: hypothetical protein HGA78_03990 [Nitrospirales bacterium]|nr:hypothetical protein [Nitrospirales bacterium]